MCCPRIDPVVVHAAVTSDDDDDDDGSGCRSCGRASFCVSTVRPAHLSEFGFVCAVFAPAMAMGRRTVVGNGAHTHVHEKRERGQTGRGRDIIVFWNGRTPHN